MKDRSVVMVLAGSTMIGALVDGCLRVEPWGLGFALVVISSVLVAMLVGARAGHSLDLQTVLLALGGVSTTAMVAVRDSPTLVAFDFAFGMALVIAIPASLLGAKIARHGPVEWILTSVLAGVDAIVGALVFVFRDVPWPRVRQARIGGPALAVTRGVILAAPPLIAFGFLLSSADAVFSHLLAELLDIDLEELVMHAIFFGTGTWLAIGWLGRAAGTQPALRPALELPASAKVGVAEVGIVLGAIDLLFLGFVAVQIRYYFGGADLIDAVPGLTRAEYARSGFFQLVTVAALVVMLLLFVDWIVERSRGALRWTRALAAVQIGLVMVMLASAWIRMRLYVHEFGLTELRFYTTAFMVWLVLALVWFCATVLVGRRRLFAAGAVALAVIALLALNIVNPDAIIVRTNVERAAMGKTFDPTYLNELSADAVPAISESLSDLRPADRDLLVKGLRRRAVRPTDWRTFNISRGRAERLVRESLARSSE